MQRFDPDGIARQAESLRALARRLVFDADAADDVVQDACLAALERGPRPGVPLGAWLARVVRNLAARRHRDAARRRRALEALAAWKAAADPREIHERVALHRRLLDAVRRLDEPYRTTVLLRYFDGLPPRVIAVRMDVSPGVVSTRLHRGVAALRAQLAREVGDDDWRAHFLPLALARGHGATATTLLAGGAVMGAKTWIGLGLGLLLAGLLAVGYRAWHAREPAPAAPEAVNATSDAPRLVGSAGDTVAPDVVAPPDVQAVLARADRDLDLHGQVVDERGRPVAGAKVSTYSFPWRRATLLNMDGWSREAAGPATESAADGTFFLRLRRGQQVNVRVRAAGHAERVVMGCVAGERLTVVLAKGCRLQVRTLDEVGRAVAGTAVRAWSTGPVSGIDPMEWTGTTDEDGVLVFAGLPARTRTTVEAIHPRYAIPPWEPLYLRADAENEIDFTLPEGRVLYGRVFDAETGAPLSGAKVGLGWMFRKAVRTAADGTYELRGYTSDSGFSHLCAVAPGHAVAALRPPFGDPVDFRLEHGISVSGSVVDRSGRPVAGAYVAAEAGGYSSAYGRTREDGAFELRSLRRSTPHVLVVCAPGHGRAVFDFTTSATDGLSVGSIVLPQARRIEGRMLLPDGSPAAGVVVELVGSNEDRDRLQAGMEPVSDRYGNRETRRTDDLGRFRFPDLAAGTYTLEARPVHRKWTQQRVDLPDGEDRTGIEIRLVGGHRLRVRVEDESAAPVAGVNVDVTCEDLYRFGQVTDPSGTIEIESDSPPRLVDVSTSFQGSDWAIPPVRTIGPDEREVVMVLHRAGHITGRLVDPDGHPVPQAILEVLADGRPFAQGSNFSPNQVWTNPQGRFRIQVPFHASVSLVAVERVQPDRTVWAGRLDGLEAGAENVELRLAPVASDRTLDVRVLRPDGTPAKDVQVYARVRATNVEGANVRTDAQGRAHLTGLPAARIGVHARPTPETVGAAAWLEAYAAEVEPAGQEVILRFEEAILLRGRVVDTAGRPVAGASVGAIRDWDRPLTFVETDEDGRFTFRLSAKQLEGLYLTASLHDRHVRLPALDPDAGEQVLTLPD